MLLGCGNCGEAFITLSLANKHRDDSMLWPRSNGSAVRHQNSLYAAVRTLLRTLSQLIGVYKDALFVSLLHFFLTEQQPISVERKVDGKITAYSGVVCRIIWFMLFIPLISGNV